MPISLKRVYEKPGLKDGKRILVERLWLRGLKKDEAKIDEWLREVAPSTELRKWFGHDPAKWMSSKRDTEKNLTIKKTLFLNWQKSAEKTRLRLCLRRKTSNTTTRLH